MTSCLFAFLIRWGDEIPLRNKVMLFLEQWYSVPSVLLVVQGGPGTLATILEAIKTTTPVVVVKGTGGAADAVAGYLAGWNSETRTSQFNLHEYEGGKFLRSQPELDCAIEAMLGLFFPIELRDSSEGLDSTILRAIVRKHRAPILESLAREEELAMSLGRRTGREPTSPGDSLTTSQTSDALLTPARSDSLSQTLSQTVGGDRGGFAGLARGLKLDRSIRLAVQWDRVEVLRDILADRVQEVLLLRQEAEAFSAAASEGFALGTARSLRRKRHAHAQQALELCLVGLEADLLRRGGHRLHAFHRGLLRRFPFTRLDGSLRTDRGGDQRRDQRDDGEGRQSEQLHENSCERVIRNHSR